MLAFLFQTAKFGRITRDKTTRAVLGSSAAVVFTCGILACGTNDIPPSQSGLIVEVDDCRRLWQHAL